MPELVVAWVLFPAMQIVLWLGCGSLVGRLLPGQVPRALLIPLGFCVVVVVGGFVTAVPGLAEWTTPAVCALAVAGLVLSPAWRGGMPSPWLAAALAALFAVYAAPIVASGEATFAGYIRLDDTATWLALTDRVMEAGRDLGGLAPSSYEATLFFNLADGYPVGVFIPLGVGRTLTGMDPAWLIQPYLALLGLMLALSLWEMSRRLLPHAGSRAAVVFIASQPALLYGYYLWGGIKEMAAAALICLVACLVFAPARGDSSARSLAPVALAIAALVGCLSLAGAVWVGPILLASLVYAIATVSPGHAVRRAGGLVVLVALLVLPVLLGGALLPPTSSPLDDPEAKGNLIAPLSALQALGIWPAGDFRVEPDAMGLTIALCALVAAGAVAAAGVALKRRRWDLAAYLVGVPAAALAIAVVGSPWVDGKAFAIASPVLLFGAVLICAWAARARGSVAVAGVATLIFAGVAWSNALAYREANLAPRDQLTELEEIGEMTAGEGPVLMTEYQPYGVRHFLREADAEGASELRRRLVPLADGSSLEKGLWADTDDFRADALDPYEALVLRHSPEQSRPPGAFELEWSGDYYGLWVRQGAAAQTVERLPLGRGKSPVARPECADVRALARAAPQGTLLAAEASRPTFLGARSGEVELEAGRYAIWVEGSVRDEAVVSVDGSEAGSVTHALNNEGLYTLVATTVVETGVHEFELEFDESGLAPGFGGVSGLGHLAISSATAQEADLETVAAADATELCGSTWDWIEARR